MQEIALSITKGDLTLSAQDTEVLIQVAFKYFGFDDQDFIGKFLHVVNALRLPRCLNCRRQRKNARFLCGLCHARHPEDDALSIATMQRITVALLKK